MAPGTRRTVLLIAFAALAGWAWALALVIGVWRWNSVVRVGPPERALFPYGELRVAIDPSNPPFAFPDGAGFSGIEPELARALGARLGVPVRLVPQGFDGLYDSVRADLADVALAGLVINPARTNDVRYSMPYFNAGLVLVTRSALSPLTSDAGFQGRVAVAYGGDAQAEAQRWLRRVDPFTIQAYETPENALDAVRLGEADAALVDAVAAGRYRATHLDWPIAETEVSVVPYAAVLRRDRPALGDALERTLADVIADGTLQIIIERSLH